MSALTLGLHLDQRHPRVRGGAVMHAISDISKPSGSPAVPDILDPGVRVAGCGSSSGDADPVLRGALEGDVDFFASFDVLELLRVDVGQEEEVRAGSLGHCHGTGYWLW